MNRRSFAGLVMALVLVAIPAKADHVLEPTGPVTEYTMEVYSYPNFATRLVLCDGSEVLRNIDGTIATDARFETFADSPARALGNPSEHWDETLTLFRVFQFPRSDGSIKEGLKYQWRTSWNHSNIKPHARGGVGGNGAESSQNSQRLDIYPSGTLLQFQGDLSTHESDQDFTVSCRLKVG